ncbi:MAG: ATP-binding cassette domain-containing protein [Dehalococcoidia bacterium]|jgi:ABC-2 type transport system ATP-binding protein|nr:ATP-binding cassette domain-containing protein [Dehalococcoidia bacterium]
MPQEHIIEVEELTKRFGPVTAVDAVSFTVAEGELFAFLGPNGAGKTTTISVLCTLLRPAAGRASVNGYDVVKQRSDVRRSIGLVFQDSTLDEYLTAEQNLRFHAYAYRVPRDVREKRIAELLDLVELSDRRKSRVRTFSGGMKRRLEIARGLLHSPKVLFLDEPTLGLDPQTRRHIWEHILELRKQHGLTIFLTTHYMEEAEVAGRIGIIDHGRIVALDTPDNLKDAMGGDVITIEARDNDAAAVELTQKFGVTPVRENGTLSFSVPHGDKVLPRIIRSLESPVVAVGLRRPTLEDVFLRRTGHAIREQEADPMDGVRAFMAHRGRGH